MRADPKESGRDFGDPFVRRLQDSVHQVKKNHEMEERFMIFEEMLQEERAEGRAEGRAEAVLELLEDLGEVPEELRCRIMSEKSLEVLKQYQKKAARAESVEQFCREISST